MCISFFSPIISLWLNWLYSSFLTSDNKKILSPKYSAVQVWALHYFVSGSWSQSVVWFFCRKQKNFKYVKVNILRNEMHNITVLMASAVGWTLQGEKWEEVTYSPTWDDALYPLITAPILSPIGICCSHLHKCFPFGGQAQRSVLAWKTHDTDVFLVQVPGAACTSSS